MAASALGLAAAPLRVLVLSLFAPAAATLSSGGASLRLEAQGAEVQVETPGAAARRVLQLRLPPVGEAPAGVVVRIDDEAGRPRIWRRFPGAIRARAAGGRLLLVNEVEPERYVAQVVASEADDGATAPAAAQALAVVARSYAEVARRRPRHGPQEADLCDTTHCQVYRGAEPAAPWAEAAAAATAGQRLGRGGAPLDAYFTESCGGSTADGAAVWGGPPRPHLSPRPCADCARDGAVAWESSIPLEDLGAALRGDGLLAPGCALAGLRIEAREPGGAVAALRASCLGGGGVALRGEALRVAVGRHLGWHRLPSARFELLPTGDGDEARGPGAAAGLRFLGRGRGHGVGLCLRGATARARAGWDAGRILRAFFPGAELLDGRGRP